MSVADRICFYHFIHKPEVELKGAVAPFFVVQIMKYSGQAGGSVQPQYLYGYKSVNVGKRGHRLILLVAMKSSRSVLFVVDYRRKYFE